MKNNYKDRIVKVHIQEYSKKGYGKGTYVNPQGAEKNVDVPFTTPGDIVEARVVSKKRGNLLCQIDQIIYPSPERIVPTCIHFGTCGGCTFQHISYEKELEQKEAFVRSSFSSLPDQKAEFHSIIPSPSSWRYRNKMEFSFSQNRQKDKFLGLMMNLGKGKVLNIEECYLANEWMITALKSVRQWWTDSTIEAYHPLRNRGALRTLTLREGFRTGDRLVMLTVSGNPEDALTKRQLDDFVACLKAIEPENSQLSIFLRIQQVAKGMATNFFEMLLYGPDAIKEILYIQPHADRPPVATTFQISPTAFFQPNTLQAERLYSRVIQMAELTKECVVYDLYCGTGTLGICMAPYVKQVISVEISPEATLDARANVGLNAIDNLIVITSAVRHILQAEIHGAPLPLPDVVLIDPPRPGLDAQALQSLIEMKPKKIIYISCNPTTQVQNISQLIEAGYRLHKVQPMDQFPQTIHIENIALLIWDPEEKAKSDDCSSSGCV
jgi:23S rRNA (uracil1939-C5)-methyltransferase